MKGTAARHEVPAEDERIAEELRLDEKSRAENLMIVDLMRNDLGRCRTRSIHVPILLHIESYEAVHQLVSVIRGELASPEEIIPCISACWSVTDALKVRPPQITKENFLELASGSDNAMIARRSGCLGAVLSTHHRGACELEAMIINEQKGHLLMVRIYTLGPARSYHHHATFKYLEFQGISACDIIFLDDLVAGTAEAAGRGEQLCPLM
ncbi:chorismate-binding protein [Bradyrhizobium sp. CCGB12]|uniref:chorismate-binding protein n=1 Tax=Bradyrhizobium sp. CCGB12 TaxID=2949632 RepID=UPI0020B19841|nr:chorismate-binding protein [Bradyrhizobium sp. CCGB12]MCP3392077.1 chorismate-binding protein [Bradyrhizobium sp. CCGB12]